MYVSLSYCTEMRSSSGIYEIHCFYEVNFAIKLGDHTKTRGTEEIMMEKNENET